MTRCLIAVSTYQKEEALETILESLVANGYHNDNDIIVTDDNAGEPYTILASANPGHPFFLANPDIGAAGRRSAPQVVADLNQKHGTDILCIHGKGRGGIAINKNRAIKHFLDNKDKYDDILLLDDDIEILSPDILERCRETRHNHLCGYLGHPEEPEGDELVWGDTNSFWAVPQFKPKGEDEHVYFSGGAQGMFIYVRKDLLERVQYFNVMTKSMYGYEHAIWSNRLNMEDGKHFDWFPVLKGCGRMFKSQSVPNNYHIENVYANQDEWLKLKELISRGIGLKVTYSGDLECAPPPVVVKKPKGRRKGKK